MFGFSASFTVNKKLPVQVMGGYHTQNTKTNVLNLLSDTKSEATLSSTSKNSLPTIPPSPQLEKYFTFKNKSSMTIK